jgi:hypothetical protein
MKKLLIILACMAVLLPAGAAEIFNVDMNTGSFQDSVSGTLPTNTNVKFSRQDKGLVGRFAGAEILDYPPTSAGTSGSLVISCYVSGIGFESLISSASEVTGDKYFLLYTTSGNIAIQTYDGTTVKTTVSSKNIADGMPHLIILTSDGSDYALYVDNTPVSLGANDGVWFGDIPDIDNFTIGASKKTSTTLYLTGDVLLTTLYSNILGSTARTTLYNDFATSHHVTKTMATNRLPVDNMIVSWDADNMPADSQSFTSGNIDIDLEVETGTFIREELAGGKQIRCTSNGTLKVYGVNLSEFVGNGYIQSLGGSLSADAGGTVDAASSVSFADNTITFTLTAGQTITNFVIQKEQ